MPFDHISERKNENESLQMKHIYVCDYGDICVETKNMRRIFSPEEFVGLLRELIRKETSRKSSVVNINKIFLKLCGLILITALFSIFIGCSAKSADIQNEEAERIVTVGGSVTETVFTLGAENLIVGTDTSSIYPEKATKLPQVGYQRQLSSEGVLSLNPTLVLATSLAGAPTALEQIKNTGIKLEIIPNDNSIEGAKSQIRQIAKSLNLKQKGEELIAILEKDYSEAQKCVESLERKPKVLFIYARGAGIVNVAGKKTAGDEMIKLAGGENVISEFENFKPLTAETIVSVQPEFILMPELSLQSIGGKEALLKMPGIAETPAGKSEKIITMDDLMLLGFTPRVGKAVLELCGKLQ